MCKIAVVSHRGVEHAFVFRHGHLLASGTCLGVGPSAAPSGVPTSSKTPDLAAPVPPSTSIAPPDPPLAPSLGVERAPTAGPSREAVLAVIGLDPVIAASPTSDQSQSAVVTRPTRRVIPPKLPTIVTPSADTLGQQPTATFAVPVTLGGPVDVPVVIDPVAARVGGSLPAVLAVAQRIGMKRGNGRGGGGLQRAACFASCFLSFRFGVHSLFVARRGSREQSMTCRTSH